jgi:GntR family transcriptional regulator
VSDGASWIMACMPPADEVSVQSQIADDLRERIETGALGPGARIPSENALAKEKGVSRITARRAIEELRLEGYLDTHPDKRGTVVRERSPLVTMLTSIERGRLDNPELREDDWAGRVRAQGRIPRQVVKVHLDVPAPASIIERRSRKEGLSERVGLHVAAKEPVVRRQRARWVAEKEGDPFYPVELSDSYFPTWVADTPLLDDPTRFPLKEDGDVVIRGGILAGLGLPMARELPGRITARIASPEVRRVMQLSRGALMYVVTLVGYDAQGRPLRVEVRQMPTDRNVLGFTVEL